MDGLGDNFVMPSFETFCERLTREQSKLSQHDVTSKSHALIVTPTKGKGKKKIKPMTRYSETSTTYSKDNKHKKEKPTCTFCMRIRHSEQFFYKKKIRELKKLLKDNNISIPSSSSSPYSSTTQEEIPQKQDKGTKSRDSRGKC